MPKGEGSRELHHLYNNAQMVLGGHPVNQERRRAGRTTVNSIWAFGAGGGMPSLKPFAETWGLRAGMLSKATSLKGLATALGMDVVSPAPERASPELLADTALDYLREDDLIFIHYDAGDSAAHRLDAQAKVEAIEEFDSVAGALLERLGSFEEYRLAVLSDHRTSPLDGKHASAPVPIAICGSGIEKDRPKEYDERLLVRGSLRLTDGQQLLPILLDVG
jgi:2,3-bisphosphoglycerate-independent phosphoglycerate mutase